MKFSSSKIYRILFKTLIAFALVVLIYIVYSVSQLVISNHTGRRRVFSLDHAAILAACREMITSYDQFDSDFQPLTRDSSKGLSFSSVDGGFSYENDSRLPDDLRALEPSHIHISTNYIKIFLSRPRRYYLYALLDDDDEANSYGHPSRVLLTNGLWYGHF